MDRNQTRKRVRETDPPTSSSPQTRKPPGYQIQSIHWLPCQTPRELSIPLDFNFWMRSRFISNAELHELLILILCRQTLLSSSSLSSSSAGFLNKSFHNLCQSNRIILVAIHGMSPMELSDCLANSLLPSLSTFTSVPLRHTISSTLQHLPETPNLTLPENIWRYSDASSASSLLFWPLVPAMSYEQVHSYQQSILSLFAQYRLVFKVTIPRLPPPDTFQMSNAVGESLGEITLVSNVSETLGVAVTGRVRFSSKDVVELGIDSPPASHLTSVRNF